MVKNEIVDMKGYSPEDVEGFTAFSNASDAMPHPPGFPAFKTFIANPDFLTRGKYGIMGCDGAVVSDSPKVLDFLQKYCAFVIVMYVEKQGIFYIAELNLITLQGVFLDTENLESDMEEALEELRENGGDIDTEDPFHWEVLMFGL